MTYVGTSLGAWTGGRITSGVGEACCPGPTAYNTSVSNCRCQSAGGRRCTCNCAPKVRQGTSGLGTPELPGPDFWETSGVNRAMAAIGGATGLDPLYLVLGLGGAAAGGLLGGKKGAIAGPLLTTAGYGGYKLHQESVWRARQQGEREARAWAASQLPTSGLGGLGAIWDDVLNLFNRASTGASVTAAQVACSDEFLAVASAGVAQRVGNSRAGQKFRELTREAQRYCTADGFRKAEEEAQEKAIVTGAWVVAGIAAIGLGVALWATTRKTNRRRRNNSSARTRRAFKALGGIPKLRLARRAQGWDVWLGDDRIAWVWTRANRYRIRGSTDTRYMTHTRSSIHWFGGAKARLGLPEETPNVAAAGGPRVVVERELRKLGVEFVR